MLWHNGLEFLGIKDENQFLPEEYQKRRQEQEEGTEIVKQESREKQEKDPSGESTSNLTQLISS